MEESRIEEDVTLAVQEPAELEPVAIAIRELLENDLAEEAIARFTRLRAPDQADVMARLARELQSALLGRLEARSVGTIIEELEPAVAVEISQGMQPEKLSQVLDETSPDVAADVLRALPEDVATRTLENMREADGIGLAQLVLARPYQHISIFMDSDVITVPAETD